jgi:hypothetical protein
MLKEGCLVAVVSNNKGQELLVDEFAQRHHTDTMNFMWVVLEETVKQVASPMTIKSLGHTMVMSIPVKDLMELLQDNDVDYESYCFFRDSFIVNHMEIRQKHCHVCPQRDHTTL